MKRVGEDAKVSNNGWSVSTADGVIGLVNLAQTVRDLPEEVWPDVVEDWLRHFQPPPELPSTFDEARNLLRIRLDPDASRPGWASYRAVCEGLDQMLMMRTEVGSVTVSDAQLQKWGVVDDELAWKEALEHTIWDEPRERNVLVKDGMTIHWISQSFYASSLLLSLKHLLSPSNRFGAIVMAPVRDALLYTEINDETFIHSSAGIIETGGRFFVDGPGSISADLFWYRPTPEGQEIRRVVRLVGSRFEPCWGRDFSAVMAELSEDLVDLDRRRKGRRKPGRTIPK